jgi:hypothetical protein
VPLYHNFFIFHLDERAGCFHLSAVVRSVAMNVCVCVCVCVPVPFGSFQCIPRSRTAGSHDNSMFNFLGNNHTAVHSG